VDKKIKLAPDFKVHSYATIDHLDDSLSSDRQPLKSGSPL